jgi:sugar/nucleoside kinase (ribokinase family)
VAAKQLWKPAVTVFWIDTDFCTMFRPKTLTRSDPKLTNVLALKFGAGQESGLHMSVLVVGSTALDSIKTPYRENPRLLGGSASHAAVAASFFCPVQLVGVVGDDFPRRYLRLLRARGIDLAGLQIRPGRTFHWSGEYEINLNNRRTLKTELGVFQDFRPDLPEHYRRAAHVLLANIAPNLQHHVLDQLKKPRFVIADTMDLWLNSARSELLRLLPRIDALVLNDSEARLLTGEDNVIAALGRIHRLGPPYVIVKKGEHGSVLSSPAGLFLAPAFPLLRVVDPTGAGDSFAGALLGYLASQPGPVPKHLRRAMIYGAAVASFWCEGFGLARAAKLTRNEIEGRVRALEKLTRVG